MRYIDRAADGTITGVYTCQQREGQESIEEDHPDMVNFANQIKLEEIRRKRDALLDEADLKYCNADKWETMTAEEKGVWRTYKQALRDLPATTEDPANPVWPEMPA